MAGTLAITSSGVVLRGASADASATTLVATGATARTLVTVGGSASYTVQGAQQPVTDAYVPVGGTALTLGSTSGLAVGDQVVVERPTTQAWIDALGMTGLWSPNWSLRAERRITAISGNRITIDVPLTTALEKRYTQALVYKYAYPRIDHVGIENLGADGQAMTADPNYATTFYNSAFSQVNAVEDGWVSNVFTHHFGQNGVTGLGAASRRISVLHTGALDMVVNTATSARSNGYTLQGQQNLVRDCALTGTKLHAFETEARQSGPNVFSRCTATLTEVTYDSGGHQRWGGGTLYDDLAIDGSLNMTNYGSQGTGHGWADANSTAWNCTTRSYLVKSPPTAHNWAIGCTGTVTAGSDGELQDAGAHVLPESLYDQQLAERTGGGVPADDFSLALSPGSGTVTAGAGTTAALSTAVTSGSAQGLTLTATGLPAGATAAFSPADVTAGAGSTLTLTTGPATPTGAYPVTVTATGAGASHTAVYTLTVTAGTTARAYVSAASGRCLGDAGASAPSGTLEVIWDCVGSADQQWTYHPATGELTSGSRCLDAFGAATTPGTKADLYTCNGHANQRWNLNADSTITGVPSGLCLDVIGNKTVNGTGVDLWTCNKQNNQKWTAS
ncbi:ricin-type beta-trefoil lectin domain protein [Kitasatospora sp. NPDC048298]|uniref:ricin-type beta-trefoil lectin domain protein n=1 Tax=Kitasatospora sp. NPDC048298 TaxID=3364049 RepID=UPI0037196A37